MRAAPGLDLVDPPEPAIRPGCVKIRVQAASVCGTDLHIYEWDEWSAGRMKPPVITGHEFCGTIVEVGDGVTDRAVGDYVASESHIVCGRCRQCLNGQAHVCVETTLLGVDVDGGFAEYAVIPAANARRTPVGIPPEIACFQDALGNAVHTAYAGPLEGQTMLITGLGPIGLFAVAVCKAAGAALVVGTEISPYRAGIARQLGIDHVLDPRVDDVRAILGQLAPGGVDGVLEMSGHPSSLDLAVDVLRPGGRLSLLGLFRENRTPMPLNQAIFKGLDVQCIIGRKLWETWDQMGALLASGKLDLAPVVTHRLPYTEIDEAMRLLSRGEAGKIALIFE